MPKLDSFRVSLNLGLFKIEGTWKPDETERKAAWEMYVELITRISLQELRPGEGLLREAFASLYTLFDTTRKILRNSGPSVAQPKDEGNLSFGYLAVVILNYALRPLLAKWHPLLLDYESTKESSVSPVDHEKKWDKYEELRGEINDVRSQLSEYANLLAWVAGVPLLHAPESASPDGG